MNESHFFLFFLYLFDLHNLNIERKLCSIANPQSEHRYTYIDTVKSKSAADEPEVLESLLVKMTLVEKGETAEKETEVDNSRFQCNLCNANYKKKGNLTIHMKNKHVGKTHYKCIKCGIPFENVRSLNKHEKTYHSEIECSVCLVRCKDKVAFDLHMQEHLCCQSCGKSFDKQWKLNKHLKTH